MKCFSFLATVVFSTVLLKAQGFTPPQLQNSSVVGITAGQTAKLNVLYPAIPAPLLQALCSITVSIVDDQGVILKTQNFQMNGGKSVSVSLNADTDLSGTHSAQIHALVITPPTSSAGGYCEVLPSLDVIDNLTGKAILHVETTITYPRTLAGALGIRPR